VEIIFCSTFSKSGKVNKVFAPLFLKVDKVDKVDKVEKVFAPLFLKVEKWIFLKVDIYR
jgi:hypothetical protein